MIALDYTGQIGPDGWSKTAVDRFLAYGRQVGRTLAPTETTEAHVTAGEPTRNPAQNRLWWRLLSDIAEGLNAAGWTTPGGSPAHRDALHLWAKWVLLPDVAAAHERETGEAVDYERTHTMPTGETVVTYTTTRLGKGAFSRLVDALLSSDLARLALDDGEAYRAEVRTVRGGAIHERNDLALAPVPDELRHGATAPASPAPDRSPVRAPVSAPTGGGQAHILAL